MVPVQDVFSFLFKKKMSARFVNRLFIVSRTTNSPLQFGTSDSRRTTSWYLKGFHFARPTRSWDRAMTCRLRDGEGTDQRPRLRCTGSNRSDFWPGCMTSPSRRSLRVHRSDEQREDEKKNHGVRGKTKTARRRSGWESVDGPVVGGLLPRCWPLYADNAAICSNTEVFAWICRSRRFSFRSLRASVSSTLRRLKSSARVQRAKAPVLSAHTWCSSLQMSGKLSRSCKTRFSIEISRITRALFSPRVRMPFFSNSSAILWYLPWLSANVLIASSRLKAP